MLRSLILIILGIPVIALLLHTITRIIRYFYKFPIPEFAANLIDNSLRRRIQPPDEMPIRHGITPGMTVLEIGPGNGTYTIAAARKIGDSGKLITIDIEPKMIQRVQKRVQKEGISNIEARVGNVFDLPFEDNSFDLVYMIAVIGEIPTPEMAMNEFFRVLSPQGSLVFSEILMDPDYPRSKALTRLAENAGFQLDKKTGGFFSYTLIFTKV
ncbi:MAG: class I SAM-dependent methyltransferase [Anaerolineales bacterium]